MTYKVEINTSYQNLAICEFYSLAEKLEKLHNVKLHLKNMYKEPHIWNVDKWIFEYELESEE